MVFDTMETQMNEKHIQWLTENKPSRRENLFLFMSKKGFPEHHIFCTCIHNQKGGGAKEKNNQKGDKNLHLHCVSQVVAYIIQVAI